ncbi:ribosome biogenesis protein ytm1, partial [Aureobasidium melanogenum]
MSTSQVRIQLSTRSPDIELPEDTGPILVSTELRRYQLSTLVNRLLETEQPVPFEFLINGQFLRTSIDEFLTANGISAETTLNVEYVRALVPPSHVASFEHDDWVSAIDLLSTTSAAGKWAGKNFAGAGNDRLVSASYDGLLRLWNQSKEVLATSGDGGHSGPVKSVKFLDHSRLVSS